MEFSQHNVTRVKVTGDLFSASSGTPHGWLELAVKSSPTYSDPEENGYTLYSDDIIATLRAIEAQAGEVLHRLEALAAATKEVAHES